MKLQLRIEEDTTQIGRLEGVIESLEESFERTSEKFNECIQSVTEIKEAVREKGDEKRRAETKLVTHEEYIKRLRQQIVELQERKHEFVSTIEKSKVKIERGKARLEEQLQMAQNSCSRDEITITEEDTQESIADEYAQIQREIKDAEQVLGSTLEDVLKELEVAEKKRDQALASENELIN